MKRCPNPNCDSTFMYDNNRNECPFCHSTLINNITYIEDDDINVLTPDALLMENVEDTDINVPFISRKIRYIECHGRITEIEHYECFYSKWHKIFNSLFHNEPYQLAHQTVEYTIRVENISNGYPTAVTDFCLYGSYLGRLHIGDEIIVKAKELGDRRVVKSIYNQTTSSTVKPGLLISNRIIWGIVIVMILMILAIAFEIVWAIKSGVILLGLTDVITNMMPVIIVCVGILFVIRSVLPKRRDRRKRY